MNILLAADGSTYTKKALQPIIKFMNRHAIRFHADWVVGSPSDEIVKVAKADKTHMIVMGTHGHNLLSRMLMGSVAQRVVTHCGMPVLLVQ